MPLLETDILVAAIDPEDPNHHVARRIIEEGRVHLSPYALIELDLLIRSNIIKVRDYSKFWSKIEELLKRFKIRMVKVRPLHFIKAYELRRNYELTYFDSLHAATAIIESLELISFDAKAYSTIRGLKYKHPSLL